MREEYFERTIRKPTKNKKAHVVERKNIIYTYNVIDRRIDEDQIGDGSFKGNLEGSYRSSGGMFGSVGTGMLTGMSSGSGYVSGNQNGKYTQRTRRTYMLILQDIDTQKIIEYPTDVDTYYKHEIGSNLEITDYRCYEEVEPTELEAKEIEKLQKEYEAKEAEEKEVIRKRREQREKAEEERQLELKRSDCRLMSIVCSIGFVIIAAVLVGILPAYLESMDEAGTTLIICLALASIGCIFGVIHFIKKYPKKPKEEILQKTKD